MKTEIGRVGQNSNGLTTDEVKGVFVTEFGDRGELLYEEFVGWCRINRHFINVFTPKRLHNRGVVRDFIMDKLGER